MYDSQEISKVSQNLSLRLSPKRKYRPEIIYCPHCCCCPCECCHSCHCCPCTCFLHSPSRERFNSPLRTNNSLKNKYSLKVISKDSGAIGAAQIAMDVFNGKKEILGIEVDI